MMDLVHFADCLLDGAQPLKTGEHARHVIEVINQGYESAKTGRTLAIETSLGAIPVPA
jgi:predicted dehydrogenase